MLFTEAHRLLDDFGVDISPRQRISTLGMAERQLVEIAKALSMKVQILLLDEPTSALSDEVPQIGQRVTVLREGQNIKKLRESGFLSFP